MSRLRLFPGSWPILPILLLVTVLAAAPALAADRLTGFDLQVKQMAQQCRAEIVKQFDVMLDSGLLEMQQLFDTFYVPIPNTMPQRFRTRYDDITHRVLQPILDKYLTRNERLAYVVAVDRNGYLPTHNSRYSQPLTGDPAQDTLNNRAKRIFNDRTGLAAARNTEEFLLQQYNRDTGEQLSDLSVPIYVHGRHWGAVRIGYR